MIGYGMAIVLESWISPKTEKNKPSKIADGGYFAIEPILKGEIIAVKQGHVIDRATLEANRTIIRDSELEIADGLYIAPLTDEEFPKSMIYLNHSCEPNCGTGGNILVVALRDIETSEEITTDYAMHFTDPTYSMVCKCGSDICRQTITGNDWLIPDLQQRYDGYFSWYIGQKIKAIKGNGSSERAH